MPSIVAGLVLVILIIAVAGYIVLSRALGPYPSYIQHCDTQTCKVQTIN